jgi:DNA-binding cell septation regulator SpoVG
MALKVNMEEAGQEEFLHYLKNVPIKEFAEYMGGDLDLAVQLRIDDAVEATYDKLQGKAQPAIEVTARPITPIKNLVGFASVKFNDSFVVEDFKILQSDKGMFVGMPSKPDKSSKTGYRDTAKPITADFRTELTGAIIEAYHAEVEQLKTRAATIAEPKPQTIKQQLAEGAKQAAKDNAARTAPDKGAQNAER